MSRISNSVVGVLNFLVLLLSIPILSSGIWLTNRHGTDCEKFVQGVVIFVGVFMMLVSLAGFLGACFRVSWLLWIYLFVMVLLMIVVFCFIIFAFVVTNREAGKLASVKVYKEYRMGNYSDWLQRKIQNPNNWKKIESCIHNAEVCKSFSRDDRKHVATEFKQRNLSPIQSGCCKPPSLCHHAYKNATYSPKTSDGDCAKWSNDQHELCYGCNSCKAGVLASAKHDWRKVALLNTGMLVFIMLVYSMGCCALKNDKSSKYYANGRRRKSNVGNSSLLHF